MPPELLIFSLISVPERAFCSTSAHGCNCPRREQAAQQVCSGSWSYKAGTARGRGSIPCACCSAGGDCYFLYSKAPLKGCVYPEGQLFLFCSFFQLTKVPTACLPWLSQLRKLPHTSPWFVRVRVVISKNRAWICVWVRVAISKIQATLPSPDATLHPAHWNSCSNSLCVTGRSKAPVELAWLKHRENRKATPCGPQMPTLPVMKSPLHSQPGLWIQLQPRC